MRAAITTDTGGFEVVELPDPTPAADELVVRVAACGVCGSDLKARPFMAAGTVMGHELGGTVVAAGNLARQDGWTDGTNVAVLPVVSCGACSWCVSGHVAHCPAVRFIGMGPDSGGFAEYATVPAPHCFPVPPGLPAHVAALVEPFAVGLHAMNTADIQAGSDVLVVGAGGVGLTTIAWAHTLGAARVTAVDPDEYRREAARELGADDTLDSLQDAEPASYDAVIECVGSRDLIAAAATPARARGRIVIAGACDQPVNVEPITALLNELSFRWSVAYRPAEFHTVIEAFATGRIDPEAVIGTMVGIDRVDEAFDAVGNASTPGRVLVTPW
jgi:(R,R)-butanediol dehydrogenase/meso-butanediol dehydrogenase/diacetyl reductase